MQGYAVIGWGSLIWDLDDLAPHVAGDWRMAAGPRLPMEFTRVSPKRRGSLVVILDQEHGVDCPTHVIASSKDDIARAVADLAARERAPVSRIGAICLDSGRTQGGQPMVVERVAAWCRERGWRGAVWTDLRSNFAEHQGTAFTVERGLAYLAGLRGESRVEAVRYIHNAPAATDTPLRRALAGEDWWRAAISRSDSEPRRSDLGADEPVSWPGSPAKS